MCEKIFWADPYLTTLSCVVTGIFDRTITVDRTIFYAESGGQESDYGSIGGIRVLRAEKEGRASPDFDSMDGAMGAIRYTLTDPPPFVVGETVSMEIDEIRRSRLMRLHFSAELVLETISQRFTDKTIEKVGAHISEDKARIDFYWPGNISAIFPEVGAQVKTIVDADLPIISDFSDSAREMRYWEIGGFARVPCGGTHPRKTGEVGDIHLKRKNIGRGKERIEITLANP